MYTSSPLQQRKHGNIITAPSCSSRHGVTPLQQTTKNTPPSTQRHHPKEKAARNVSIACIAIDGTVSKEQTNGEIHDMQLTNTQQHTHNHLPFYHTVHSIK
jgi:hypothetical protein